MYLLMINKTIKFSSFFVGLFSKRNRKHFLRVSIYRNTREGLGELEKAVETLACGSCSQSISRSPKPPNVSYFLNNNYYFT